MSRIVVLILICYRNKPINLIYLLVSIIAKPTSDITLVMTEISLFVTFIRWRLRLSITPLSAVGVGPGGNDEDLSTKHNGSCILVSFQKDILVHKFILGIVHWRNRSVN
jgi:hypothetical protein